LESGDAKWERMFKELCAYKKEYGHCNVPKRKFKELGSWVQVRILVMFGKYNIIMYVYSCLNMLVAETTTQRIWNHFSGTH
jgi:hypothetical protein